MQFKKARVNCLNIFLIIPLLLFLVIPVLAGCGVSREVFNLKSQEADLLHTELQSGKKRLFEAESQVAQQKTQIVELSRESKSCKDRNQELTSVLNTKVAAQGKMVEDLLDQNQKLSGDLNIYKLKTEEKEQKIRELTETIKRLEAKREKEVTEVRTIYDGLLDQLKEEIHRGEIQIRQLSDRLSINVVDKVFFDSGQAEIKEAGLKVLTKVGKALEAIKEKKIQIVGHTDNVPIQGQLAKKFPTNWELSSARAIAVVRFLQEKVGIEGSLVSAVAYSEYQPVASNETSEGRSLNRRIEIVMK